MTMQDKRAQMMRRKPQPSTNNTAPDFKRAFRDPDEGREPKKKLTAMLTQSRFEKLRLVAFQRHTTMTAVVSELIDTLEPEEDSQQ